MSGDHNGTVCVWSLATGKLRFRFVMAHDGSKITAMSFDTKNRRLLTGSEDGVCKVLELLQCSLL